MVSTCNSKHFATRVQEKETKKLGRVGKDDINFFSKIYCFIWNTAGASERNMLHNVTRSFLEMDSRVK